MKFRCVPKRDLLRRADRLQTGDLIFFASVRPHLDVFHCGILVKNPNGWQLRHASRKRSGVVEQSLAEFLNSNRMAGTIVVRATEVA